MNECKISCFSLELPQSPAPVNNQWNLRPICRRSTNLTLVWDPPNLTLSPDDVYVFKYVDIQVKDPPHMVSPSDDVIQNGRLILTNLSKFFQ